MNIIFEIHNLYEKKYIYTLTHYRHFYNISLNFKFIQLIQFHKKRTHI